MLCFLVTLLLVVLSWCCLILVVRPYCYCWLLVSLVLRYDYVESN